MDKRNALRAGAVTAAATLMMLMSSPAFAEAGELADAPYKGLTVAQSLGLYVGIPLLAFAVIAGLVMVGSKSTVSKKK